jgi:hypothetical protein
MIRNHLMIFACVLAMSPAFAQASTEEDGVAVFFNLCGGTVAAVETPFDPSAFKFTKLGPDVLKKIRPTEEGPFWDVQSSRSDLRGLAHIWTNGNCTFELVKANERATREAYDHQLANFALEIGGVVERRPDKVTLMEGLPMTSSEWLVTAPDKAFLLGLTTYPKMRFMTQHMMLMRKVR